MAAQIRGVQEFHESVPTYLMCVCVCVCVYVCVCVEREIYNMKYILLE